MKSLVLGVFLASVLTGSVAVATESSVIACYPKYGADNELNITSLVLNISDEGPNALMRVTRKNGTPYSVNMTYDGSSTLMHFVPHGEKDGRLGVYLRNYGGWTAYVYVTDSNLTIHSSLGCVQK